jgi:hypothetical protein
MIDFGTLQSRAWLPTKDIQNEIKVRNSNCWHHLQHISHHCIQLRRLWSTAATSKLCVRNGAPNGIRSFCKAEAIPQRVYVLLSNVYCVVRSNFSLISSVFTTIIAVQRPYRIPVPDWAAVLIVIPPTVGILFVFATSNWFVYVFCAAALLLGYSVSKASKSRGWAYDSKGKV